MKSFEDLLAELAGDDNQRLLEVARMAELGLSASAVIHELRQPLTALIMSLQMTMEAATGRGQDLEDGLRDAISLASKTQHLLERARDFIRPDDSIGFKNVDLLDVVAKVVTVFQWQVSKLPNVQMRTHVPDDLPQIRGDSAQLEQLLTNLCSNALDAVREQEHGLVVVHLDNVNNESVSVLVADNGGGIEKDIQSRIFQPFFTTKEKSTGTGLGLYIVSKIAQRHRARYRYCDRNAISEFNVQEGVTTGFQVVFQRSLE